MPILTRQSYDSLRYEAHVLPCDNTDPYSVRVPYTEVRCSGLTAECLLDLHVRAAQALREGRQH